MASLTMSHPMPTMRSLRPKRVKKQPSRNAAYTPIPPTMLSISSSSSKHSSSSSTTTCSNNSNIKKPMRPLTAYHIFFQIEREFIIQTTAGSDADPSIHNGKSYLPHVPRRYRSIKLLPDWYAGPGKRQKRKHRKSHGKIGFLELSRVISKRWATLDSSDPETKRFVSEIAARELGEYKVEMAEYKELTKDNIEPTSTTTYSKASPVPTAAAAAPSPVVSISPSSSPSPKYYPMDIVSSSSSGFCQPCSFNSPMMAQEAVDEIDYTICKQDNNGHYIPSPPTSSLPTQSSISFFNKTPEDGSICDPLFELDEVFFEASTNPTTRCVSPVSSSSLSSSSHGSVVDNVFHVSEDDFFGLL